MYTSAVPPAARCLRTPVHVQLYRAARGSWGVAERSGCHAAVATREHLLFLRRV